MTLTGPTTFETGTPLPSLTGARFVAAAAVALNHLTDYLAPDANGYFGTLTQAAGRTGVAFFFILSGFVLTWSNAGGYSLGGFYRRRVARIYPMHVVTWFIALAVLQSLGDPVDPRGFLAGLFLVQAWHPSPDVYFAVNGVAWSLSVEAFFYLAFPALLPLVNRARRPVAVMAGCVGLAVAAAVLNTTLDNGATSWTVQILPLVQLPSFVAGVALAKHLRAGGRVATSRRSATLLVAVAVAVLPFVPPAMQPTSITIVPFLLLIATLANADRAGLPSWLARPAAVRLGAMSFAFYMVHELVFRAVDAAFALEALPLIGTLTAMGGMVAGALVAAMAIHDLIENPAERFLRGRSTKSGAP